MLLTVRETAALLACTEREIYRWVADADLPFQRVRDQLRFNRSDLLEWANSRRMRVPLDAFDVQPDLEDRSPSLALAIRAGGVHFDLPDTDRNSVLRSVVELTPIPDSLDRELLIEVLIAREHTSSTAIGNGIAIPHVRQPVVAPGSVATVSISYLRSPVPFGAPDGKPVQILFFIVSPTVRSHLQMLARVARALLEPTFRAALDRHADADELCAAADQLEQQKQSPQHPADAPT